MANVVGGVDQLERLFGDDSAVVYSGYHRSLATTVAIRVFADITPEFANRLETEVKQLFELNGHPNLVTVFEVGRTESDQPYVIFELCDTSVQEILDRGFRYDPDEACILVSGAALAAEAIHGAGMSHCQIRPSNLLVKDGRYLLGDIGLMGATTSSPAMTLARSAPYAAPETIDDGDRDHAADVYSLGATLFHLVSGRAPFVSEADDSQIASLLHRIAQSSVPNLRPEGVSDAVCLVIESAMRKEATYRPAVSEMRAMLHAAAGVEFFGGTPGQPTAEPEDAPAAHEERSLGSELNLEEATIQAPDPFASPPPTDRTTEYVATQEPLTTATASGQLGVATLPEQSLSSSQTPNESRSAFAATPGIVLEAAPGIATSSSPPPPTIESLRQLGAPQKPAGQAAEVLSRAIERVRTAFETLRAALSQYVAEARSDLTQAKNVESELPLPPMSTVLANQQAFEAQEGHLPPEQASSSQLSAEPDLIKQSDPTKRRESVDELASGEQSALGEQPELAGHPVAAPDTALVEQLESQQKSTPSVLGEETEPAADGDSLTGVSAILPVVARTASGGIDQVATVFRGVKELATTWTKELVDQPEGEGGQQANEDEPFSGKTLLLAGGAIGLFFAFAVVVALSFGGETSQSSEPIDPANPTILSSSEDGGESSGSLEDGNSGASRGDPTGSETDVPSSAADGARSEPFILTSQANRDQQAVVQLLASKGIEAKLVEEQSGRVEAGKVIRTDPDAGNEVELGQVVTLFVSTGPACDGSIVPSVSGLELNPAQAAVSEAGLASTADQVVDGTARPGTVTASNPPGGECAQVGDPVLLLVACQSTTVPPEEGFTVANAKDLGLEVNLREVERPDLQPGQLVSIEPGSGAEMCLGSEIVVTVNRACDLVSLPDLVGRKVDRADQILRRQRLQPQYVEEFSSEYSRADVIRTKPESGVEVCSGSQVTVYVSLGEDR